MNQITYYPDILINQNQHSYKLSTTLRKLHTDNKYYLWLFISKGTFNPNANQHLILQAELEILIRHVYLTLITGTVQPNLTDPVGIKLFPIDPSQQPEHERLLKPHYNNYNHVCNPDLFDNSDMD